LISTDNTSFDAELTSDTGGADPLALSALIAAGALLLGLGAWAYFRRDVH
jgi:hypothetical protein